jgi:hypothetical protein
MQTETQMDGWMGGGEEERIWRVSVFEYRRKGTTKLSWTARF